MTPLELLTGIRFSGPNEAGEYWLHLKTDEGWCALNMGDPRIVRKHIEQWEAARQAAVSG